MDKGDLPKPPENTQFVDGFLTNAFVQVKNLPPKNTIWNGIHSKPFTKIRNYLDKQLHQIRTDLSSGILKPIFDMDPQDDIIYKTLGNDNKKQVDALQVTKKELINMYIQRQISNISKQVLTSGVLEVPQQYYRQKGQRMCETANFCAIFHQITGHAISEDEIIKAASKEDLVHEGEFGQSIKEDILYNLFQTPAFKDAFLGIDVEYDNFFGFDFDDIKNLIDQVKQNSPNVQFFCTTSIESELLENGWHDVILLSADENQVTIHDPSKRFGSAFRQIPKEDFIKRWGKTALSGKLIIVNKQERNIH